MTEAGELGTREEEQWRAVAGANYEVSDAGRVRSWRDWSGRLRGSPRVLSPVQQKRRLYVTICYGNSVRKAVGVHRLVLEAFRGPCPPGFEGCHNDGNPSNNRLENLRWDTHRNNIADQIRHGTRRSGERHPNTKVKGEARETVRRLLREGFSMKRVANLYGVNWVTVRKIKVGRGGDGGDCVGDSDATPLACDVPFNPATVPPRNS